MLASSFYSMALSTSLCEDLFSNYNVPKAMGFFIVNRFWDSVDYLFMLASSFYSMALSTSLCEDLFSVISRHFLLKK
jgi:hypothetical protein